MVSWKSLAILAWSRSRCESAPLELLATLERIAVALQVIARAQRLEVPGNPPAAGRASTGNDHEASTAGGVPGPASDPVVRLESQITEIRDLLKKQERLARTMEKKVYSVDEAAELTGYKAWTIRQGCNKGRIKGKKGDDGRWRISHEEVHRLQEEGLPAE